MGTRAQFFIGNPEDLQNREWLGCVAWDGHPSGDCGDALRGATTPEAFRAGVADIKSQRDDFTDPATRSWPFPWVTDLYLTDTTFAFFDGKVQATSYHSGWRPLEAFYADDPYGEDHKDELPRTVPAPVGAPGDDSKPRGPDSIMILAVPKE